MRTRQVERLTSFYRDLFGLEVLRERPGESVWLSLGDAVLMIERASEGEPGIPAGTMEFFALRVSAARRIELESALGRVGASVESRTEHTTYVRDPDGRRVGFSTHPLGR